MKFKRLLNQIKKKKKLQNIQNSQTNFFFNSKTK